MWAWVIRELSPRSGKFMRGKIEGRKGVSDEVVERQKEN